MAKYYGVSSISDAYILATTIPIAVFTLFASAVNANFIPQYHKIVFAKGKLEANIFTSNVFNILLLVISLIVLLIVLYPSFFIKLFASGFDNSTTVLASNFLRLTAFTLFMNLFFNVFKNYLQVNDRLIPQVLATIPMNIIVTAGIMYSVNKSVDYMIYAFVIGSFAQVLIIFPAIVKSMYIYKKSISFNTNIISFFILSIPIFIQSIFMEISIIVNKNIASLITVGGISSFTYAKNIENVIYALFVSVIIMITYPKISKFHSEGDMVNFQRLSANSILMTFFLTLPATFGLFFFSEDVVRLVYARGEFGDSSILMTSSILKYSSIGISFLAVNQIIVRLFYVQKNTKIPLILYLFGLCVNIALNLISFNLTNLGLAGIALSTSVSYLVISLLGYFIYKSKYGYEFGNDNIIVLFKIILSCLAMVFLTDSLLGALSFTRGNSFLIIFIATFFYTFFILLFCIKDVKKLFS